MERIPVKDSNYRLVGYYENQDNGDKVVRDPTGRILVYYVKKSNWTLDPNRRMIAIGDVTGLLFRDVISF